MADGLREAYGPVLGTVRLLLDEIRLLVEDGSFGQVQEENPEPTATAAPVDGTGIPSTAAGGAA